MALLIEDSTPNPTFPPTVEDLINAYGLTIDQAAFIVLGDTDG